jgi:hypothetical protein
MHRDFQIALLFLVISSAPVTTSAGSREFEQLVQSLETQHHRKRTRVPMWRLLRPMVKTAAPAGVKTVDMATFEGGDFFNSDAGSQFELDLERIFAAGWQPMVRSLSRRDEEQTWIYARPKGKDLQLMILTQEPDDAVVIEALLRPQSLGKWLENPAELGLSTDCGNTDDPDK